MKPVICRSAIWWSSSRLSYGTYDVSSRILEHEGRKEKRKKKRDSAGMCDSNTILDVDMANGHSFDNL